jgi:hypothetical protein
MERCKEQVQSQSGFGRFRNCSRAAIKDGYCLQHHPESVNARRQKQQEKWEEQHKRREAPFTMIKRLCAMNDELRGALADIAYSEDMTLKIARAKADRIYKATASPSR